MSDFFFKGGVYQPWIFHLDMVVTITSHDSRWRPYKKTKQIVMKYICLSNVNTVV